VTGPKPSAPSRQSVTIRDVATEAGVGLGTVSRVLNGTGYTSPEAREAVQRAVARLHYRPSRRARSLRQARSLAIAAMVPNLMNPVYVEFLRGVQRAATEHGYVVLIAETPPSSGPAESPLVRRVIEEGVDGLVLGGPLGQVDLAALREAGVPVVPGSGPEYGSFTASWEAGESDATLSMVKRLIDLGHRRVGYVVRPEPRGARLGRYRRARDSLIVREIRAVGGSVTRVPLEAGPEGIGRPDPQGEADPNLSGPDRPTAFIASSHQLTPRLLLALRRAALEIPTDASVVVYGDSEWAAAYRPALTVIRHDTSAEAAWLTERLIEELEGRSSHQPPVVRAEYIERESCGPAPGQVGRGPAG